MAVVAALAAGLPLTRAVRCAKISRGTWRNWQKWESAGQPQLALRGRPPRCATPAERRDAIDFLVEYGREVPVQALCKQVPGVPRVELADLRRRFQRISRWRRDRHRGKLLWKRVGTVWAIDFTELAEYVGGTDRWILAIRDLTSGYQLAWLAFPTATAEGVIQILRGLFVEFGAPLVLKSDNGSQFIAHSTLALLAEWRVTPLFNPPRRPAYNGGLERTHPILKSYTDAAAARHNRPKAPLPEDLATARQNANRFTHRLGPKAPSADALWQHRQPITDHERSDFQEAVRVNQISARAERGLTVDATLSHYQQAAVDRDAVRKALVEKKLLEIQPRHRGRGRGGKPGQPIATTTAPTVVCVPNVPSVEELPHSPSPPLLELHAPAEPTSNESRPPRDPPAPRLRSSLSVARHTPSLPPVARGSSAGAPVIAPTNLVRHLALHIACDIQPPALPARPAPTALDPRVDALGSEEFSLKTVAAMQASCTIPTAPAASPRLVCDVPSVDPGQRRPGPINLLRRLITPLVNRLRIAKIW